MKKNQTRQQQRDVSQSVAGETGGNEQALPAGKKTDR
jgi:hypothetical protein